MPATPVPVKPVVDNCEVVIVTPPSLRLASGQSETRTTAHQPQFQNNASTSSVPDTGDRNADPSTIHAGLVGEIKGLKEMISQQQATTEKLETCLQSVQAKMESLQAQLARLSAVENELRALKDSLKNDEAAKRSSHEAHVPSDAITTTSPLKVGEKRWDSWQISLSKY